ncbi:phosphoribosyltransferase family protein [Altibacter sp.]|uniref:ComF family protein n=1 Tax=Altibacter sp. TaxID=2024823 RepID=UPI0025883C38|nr:phosphoribosyltransferase family protein [Altibacter sp.]MCW8981557.1 phosphoribosyltransferase family protein [Altibacter sp.]MCW9038137.1 phosphoribosyltransferase family protein [Altibacter sp.]
MLNLLFPKVCAACKNTLLRAEKILCVQCLHSLPLACHHRNADPTMKNVFYGRIPLEQATALLKFEKRGRTQEILHQLKYRGQQEISSYFGMWLGAELGELDAYRSVDMVIPVPLHKQKLRKRGYNQVAGFGKAIATSLQVPYRDDILLKISKTNSQVFKQRFTRFSGEALFTVKNTEALTNKHILLVDDIVTTGATLESCGEQLLKGSGVKLSLATIAIA